MRQDMAALRRFAHASGAVALLKGAETMLAAPDGHIMLAVEGPSWLATAGSGDVLSGVIAAQLASGQPAFAAASTGQWLFERAAQLAGPVLRPEDVIVQLPLAVSECL
jgi:NAD(P)H-hydrate repair Nnr-like enzyme with NAD(P)H-hydrate dehydratase domain